MANISPIYSKQAVAGWAPLTAGDTAKDGTSGTTKIFNGDDTEGGFVSSIVAVALGTNVQTVLRIFLNNGSTPGTAANNSMIAQATLPATTNSETGALTPVEIPINKPIPPGYDLYAVLGTTVSAGWQVTAFGGKY